MLPVKAQTEDNQIKDITQVIQFLTQNHWKNSKGEYTIFYEDGKGTSFDSSNFIWHV